MKIEIKKIGNSDGLLLPRELMQRLDLKRGQQLHIEELPGGGFQALPYDPDFERTMEIADEVMDKYRDTLAALGNRRPAGYSLPAVTVDGTDSGEARALRVQVPWNADVSNFRVHQAVPGPAID